MRRFLAVLRLGLWSGLVLIAVAIALFGYFVYTPTPAVPRLSGALTKGSIEVGGVRRSYMTYVPQGLPHGAPLVVVLHGSGGNGAWIRAETGYAFDRLADAHGFAIAYPHAHDGYWDVCSIVGAIETDSRGVDDVGFLTGLVEKLIADLGVDPRRVFAVGSSRGGSMALRLALEAPTHFRAVAAVSASVPTPVNFKCRTPVHGTSSVMIMNGTHDPIVPFQGGDVSLLGMFYRNGPVRSSRDSGQFFADLNRLVGAPLVGEIPLPDGMQVEDVLWRNDSRAEVELVAIHGAGHGLPQPYRRRPRILGPSAMEPDGAALIWAFFERQQKWSVAASAVRPPPERPMDAPVPGTDP